MTNWPLSFDSWRGCGRRGIVNASIRVVLINRGCLVRMFAGIAAVQIVITAHVHEHKRNKERDDHQRVIRIPGKRYTVPVCLIRMTGVVVGDLFERHSHQSVSANNR
jgi:hypothetical protein